jgi:hypothetical protein
VLPRVVVPGGGIAIPTRPQILIQTDVIPRRSGPAVSFQAVAPAATANTTAVLRPSVDRSAGTATTAAASKSAADSSTHRAAVASRNHLDFQADPGGKLYWQAYWEWYEKVYLPRMHGARAAAHSSGNWH